MRQDCGRCERRQSEFDHSIPSTSTNFFLIRLRLFKRDGEDLGVMIHKVHRQPRLNETRQVIVVLPIHFRQYHRVYAHALRLPEGGR